MITLYSFGPAFGLPDPSPFVMKAEVLLKMAGLSYRADTKGLRGAPKGKLPYIEDDGERIADSTFIRWHIEKKYGFDFDRGLSAEALSALLWTLWLSTVLTHPSDPFQFEGRRVHAVSVNPHTGTVLVGTTLTAAERARRGSLCGRSSSAWSPV